MAIAQCPRCKAVFNKNSGLVCQKCNAQEEEDYEQIRAIMVEKEGCSVEEVAEASETEKSTVMRMLELGLIADIRDDSFKCGRCGAPAISASRKLCQNCLGDLDRQVSKSRNKMLAGSVPSTSVRSSLEAKRR